MSKEEYSGPETNEVYSDEDTYETFDDLDDDIEETEDDEQQSATSHDGEDGMDDEEDEGKKEIKGEKARRDARKKKDAAKKARGQKGDDIDSLEDSEENFNDLEDEEEEEEVEDEEKSDKPEEVEEKSPKDEKPLPKGKPSYVTVDGETYALDSNSLVSVPVDGKMEKVTLQELKNQYNAKVVGDKRFNEVNLKEQSVKRLESDVTQKLSHYTRVKEQIDEIIKDPSKNPKDALKIFLDQSGVDSYDLMERMFKADLTELANVLNMEPTERKAYFLEKKNSHLLDVSKKRDERQQTDEKRNSYTQKVNALRNSFGVSEAQYMDALDELKTYEDEKNISEREIVEWAATKPHRATVKTLLEPYLDQLQGNAYGKLQWDLANLLREGTETPEIIKKHLADVYGVPTEVRQLSKKLNPLGRKSQPLNKPQPSSKKKNSYESFDDFDDE